MVFEPESSLKRKMAKNGSVLQYMHSVAGAGKGLIAMGIMLIGIVAMLTAALFNPPSSAVAAMCIEGELRSSEGMARLLDDAAAGGEKCLVFLVGGSFGLDEGLKKEAWVRLSMSPMTFPHHLARVMLLEQIYRGFQINEGGKYHK